MIFIAHADADQAVAKLLAKHIETCGSNIKTFVSSRSGDIRADAEWLPSVQEALRKANAYVILLTPNSVLRLWVSFETGVAWFSERKNLLVRAGGLGVDDIPFPISFKQIYSLDSAEDAQAVFRALDLAPSDLTSFVTEVACLFRQTKLVGNTEPVWEGVKLDGIFYAWAGQLLTLDDKLEVQCQPELLQMLEQRGLSYRFGNKDRLSHHYSLGRCQVFATDRKSWRRPVVSGKQLLLVARPEDSKQ